MKDDWLLAVIACAGLAWLALTFPGFGPFAPGKWKEDRMEPCARIVLRTQWGMYLLDSEKGWRPIKEYPHAADWAIPEKDGVYATVDGTHVVMLETVAPSSGWVIPTPTVECLKESCSTCGT